MSARQTVGYYSVHRAIKRDRIEALFVPPPIPEPIDDIAAWRSRPLVSNYALVFFDSLLVKIREQRLQKNKRLHLALGIAEDGSKDILDYWLEEPLADQFWTSAVARLQQRALCHIDIAVVEKPAAENAIRARFPATRICPSALATLPPALRALCASTTAVESVIEKRRRRGLSKPGSFASGEAAVRDLLFVLQDAHTGWKVSPARWSVARAELLTLRHPPPVAL